jgi:alanine racemase
MVQTSQAAAHPTWVEVSLEALSHNFLAIQQHVGVNVTVCAVVKADAYGHGAVSCALALERAGAKWLGVASVEEALRLRQAGITARILLMAGFWPGEEAEVVRHQLTPAVWEASQLQRLSSAAASAGVYEFPVHLKIDTGMGRLGTVLSDVPAVLDKIKITNHLLLEGVASHLASAEILDAGSNERQALEFGKACEVVKLAGMRPRFIHLANTSAIIARPSAWYNMVRPGVALYGYSLPLKRSDSIVEVTPSLHLKPALQWKTRILTVRQVEANQALGYGGTYITPGPSRVAVLPVGYSDGLNRALSSRGRAIVRGAYASIVGIISMNLTLLDVTTIPGVETGDEVTLIGTSGGLSVSAQEHAELAKTISYDILCGISKHAPRKYSPGN